jgi:hypothetical protein
MSKRRLLSGMCIFAALNSAHHLHFHFILRLRFDEAMPHRLVVGPGLHVVRSFSFGKRDRT